MTCSDTLPATLGALAAAIARDRSDEELALIAAVLVQLGDSLETILAARAACPEKT